MLGSAATGRRRSPPAAARRAPGAAQGRLRLCRPDRRPWLDLPPRRRPAGGREGLPRQGRDQLRRERRRRPRRRARHPPARQHRPRADLHHLVRLHEPDPQGRQAVPEREVRARHRLPGPPNVAVYNARFYEGRAVIGTIAGMMTKSGMVGYIGSFPIPEVVMGINAFTLAAQKVNPNFKTKVVWVIDLVRSGQGGRRRQGADRPGRRHHHPAHRQRRAAAAGRAARRVRLRPGRRHERLRAQGASSPRSSTIGAPTTSSAPRRCSTAPGSRSDVWHGLKEGMVEIAPFGPSVPPEVAAAPRRSGTRSSPARATPSPGRSTSRTARPGSRPGRRRTDKDLLSMNFYVEGVEGSLPK